MSARTNENLGATLGARSCDSVSERTRADRRQRRGPRCDASASVTAVHARVAVIDAIVVVATVLADRLVRRARAMHLRELALRELRGVRAAPEPEHHEQRARDRRNVRA